MPARISVVAWPIGLMLMGLMGASVWVATPAASQDAAKARDSASGVTFQKDVLPVLQKNCQSCHRPGQIGPFSMLTYKDARPWAKAMKAAVVSKKMPPWLADRRYGHFENDRSLKQADLDTIVAWVDSGAPEGDPKKANPRPARRAQRRSSLADELAVRSAWQNVQGILPTHDRNWGSGRLLKQTPGEALRSARLSSNCHAFRPGGSGASP